MTLAEQVLFRLHRQGEGFVMGTVIWPPQVLARLREDGLLAAGPRLTLTAAGEAAARRLVEGRAADGPDARPALRS